MIGMSSVFPDFDVPAAREPKGSLGPAKDQDPLLAASGPDRIENCGPGQSAKRLRCLAGLARFFNA